MTLLSQHILSTYASLLPLVSFLLKATSCNDGLAGSTSLKYLFKSRQQYFYAKRHFASLHQVSMEDKTLSNNCN